MSPWECAINHVIKISGQDSKKRMGESHIIISETSVLLVGSASTTNSMCQESWLMSWLQNKTKHCQKYVLPSIYFTAVNALPPQCTEISFVWTRVHRNLIVSGYRTIWCRSCNSSCFAFHLQYILHTHPYIHTSIYTYIHTCIFIRAYVHPYSKYNVVCFFSRLPTVSMLKKSRFFSIYHLQRMLPDRVRARVADLSQNAKVYLVKSVQPKRPNLRNVCSERTVDTCKIIHTQTHTRHTKVARGQWTPGGWSAKTNASWIRDSTHKCHNSSVRIGRRTASHSQGWPRRVTRWIDATQRYQQQCGGTCHTY